MIQLAAPAMMCAKRCCNMSLIKAGQAQVLLGAAEAEGGVIEAASEAVAGTAMRAKLREDQGGRR